MQSLESLYKIQRTNIAADFDNTDLIERAASDPASRNQLLNNLILLVDMNYYAQERRLHGEKSWADFGSSVVVLGLNAAGAATGAAEVSRAMNAISAVIVGTKAAADRDLLQNQGILAIIAKMRANRASHYSILAQSMNRSTEKYSLQAGLVDIAAYYNAGSLTNALQSIVVSAGQQKSEANAATAEARDLKSHIPD